MSKKSLSTKHIVKVSAALFRTKSFTDVSMRDIAKALDVKASSLYNHIKSKQQILELIIFDLVDKFMREIKETRNRNTDIKSELIEIIQTHIKIAIHQPNAFATLNNDWKYLNQIKKSEFLDKRRNYELILYDIIKEGQSQDIISKKNPDIIIYMMLSSLRTLHLWYEKRDQNEEILMKEIPSLILGGILN
jgi:AcrR family transcriptional regulator